MAVSCAGGMWSAAGVAAGERWWWEAVTMANPQPEPFVKFSKELFDALLLSAMPATHKEIVLAVIRRTYGDHGKKEAPISHSLLRRMTGRADSGIRRCLSALCTEGVLRVVRPADFRSPAVFSLNKDYESWGRWSVQSATTVAEGQELAEGHDDDSGDRQTLAEGSATTVAEGSATTVAPLKILEILEDLRDPTGASAPPETDPVTTQAMVAFAVDYCREHGYDLADDVKGHLAREIGKQFKAGRDPALIRDGISELLELNKSPERLSWVMGDIQRRRNGGRTGAHSRDRVGAASGRSEDGEW